MTLTIPVQLVSEANQREHWATRLRRKKRQQAAVRAHLLAFGQRPPLPVSVTLTRLGARRLDPDNLAGSFKHAQDEIARWLGVDDGNERLVRWIYEQEPARKVRQPTRTGAMRMQAVCELRIEVEPWNEAQGEPLRRREVA